MCSVHIHYLAFDNLYLATKIAFVFEVVGVVRFLRCSPYRAAGRESIVKVILYEDGRECLHEFGRRTITLQNNMYAKHYKHNDDDADKPSLQPTTYRNRTFIVKLSR